jgi:hypothetical protein
MRSRIFVSRFFVALGALAAVAFANASAQKAPLFRVDGTVQFQIRTNPVDLTKSNLSTQYSVEELSGFKTISLMHIQPTEAMLKKLVSATPDTTEPDFGKSGTIKPFQHNGSTVVDLGMNNVPVLDQGAYGTCVTFSSTAALDALEGSSDYIDQQCSLELDIADTADDTYPEGGLSGNYWDGAYLATQVINPLVNQGVIKKGGCFKKTYPSSSARLTSLKQYTDASDKNFLKGVNVVHHDNLTLDDMKAALKKGHRMVFASLIGSSVSGFDVQVNGVKGSGGLWACKQKSQASSENDCNGSYAGGHEIVAIGFDDKQQLVKIRNSWSDTAGDKGDYYMTYAYFKYWVEGYNEDGTEIY